jgi:TasA anchoring/assembly protein
MFIDRGALCEGGGVVWAIVKNGGQAMTGTSVWELWYASSGPPKQGTPIADGEIPALGAGQEYTIDEEAGEGSGNYMFKVSQRPGHPGDGVLWSNEIVFECGN